MASTSRARRSARAFGQGVLVVQDGRNLDPAERQNFKLVPWASIVEAMQPAP